MAHVLVVGAGLAGARTCVLLREHGFAGRITLIGEEAEPPYDRPPLTKQPDAQVDLRRAVGVDVWAAADEVRLGTRATGVVRDGDRMVVTVADERVPADAVVVATGAAPVCPPGWRGTRSHVLHTRLDASRFWAAAVDGVDLVVVGGGWIGCEAASTAAMRGCRVVLHEAAGQLLPGRVPAEVAGRVAGWLTRLGVTVHLGSPIDRLDRGVAADADLVLVGLGVRPATGWLAGSGIALGEGGAVLVDPWGRSSLPGLLAVGDCAARWSPRVGGHVPGGHWTAALNDPDPVARGVLAGLGTGWASAPAGTAPDPVPYVFSEVAGRTLQVLGDAGTPGDVVWQESAEGWTALVVDPDGGLRGVVSTGRPRDVARARRAMQADPAGRPPALAVVGG